MNKIKNFFKFAQHIVHESLVLSVKYIFVGIYFIILTVLVNRFNISDLTYFNGVFAILIFSDIIGYGIGSGISIYINQNINNKEVVKKHIKLSLIIASVFAVLFTLIIIIFKDYLFSKIIVVEITDGYKFFYTMVPVIFLNIIISYFEDILKILKEFKMQLILEVIKNVIILLGILLIVLTGNLNIYHISAFYTLSFIVMIPIIIYVFKYRTKVINIDLLKLNQIKSTKDIAVIKTLAMIVAKEVAWNIGYTLSALILLKKSELLYNSYNYFENILDVCVGLYFSVINVSCISVCRDLGKKDFEKAYKEGKYVIDLTFLMWCFLAILYIVFRPIILSGMNIEISSTGDKIAYIYLLIQLFRYIDWTLNSYLLTLGGKAKLPFILDVLSLVYFVILFVVSDYIPSNDYLLIFLVGFDSFVKMIINLGVFKSKVWLANVSEEDLELEGYECSNLSYEND
ncbi:MAG: MATE family efflux transporter [Clostridia bacterium]|nr:MATE family efflux transporter [Clostridia bacterium]